MSFTLGEPLSLRDYLDRCLQDSRAGEWMVCQNGDYALDTPLYPLLLDDWDLDPQQLAAEEQALAARGYRNCLTAEQLVDIADNLEWQKADYSDQELEQAINHYASQGCFISL